MGEKSNIFFSSKMLFFLHPRSMSETLSELQRGGGLSKRQLYPQGEQGSNGHGVQMAERCLSTSARLPSGWLLHLLLVPE